MRSRTLNMPLAAALSLAALLAFSPASAQEGPEILSLPAVEHAPAVPKAADVSVGSPAPSAQTTAATNYRLTNGLDVTVYGSDLLASRLEWREGDPVIPLDDGRYLSVITDIDDPSIYNKGDGSFHPFPLDKVLDVLDGIGHTNMDLHVDVYILPYPRRNLLVSSTTDDAVFLSPHVLDIHPAVCAYIVAHEMGHVFHNAYMPDGSRLWHRYRVLRGITDTNKFNATSVHAYRPKEIFAEDFRVMFGGYEAAFGGRVENPELLSPTLVAGLEPYVAGIGGTPVATGPRVRATSYPNPFNPETEIRITLPDEIRDAGQRVSVRIYSVRGALVRELFSDVPATDKLYVHWDGRDQRGNAVASSSYFALIEAGSSQTTLKLVLLK